MSLLDTKNDSSLVCMTSFILLCLDNIFHFVTFVNRRAQFCASETLLFLRFHYKHNSNMELV